MPDPKPGCRVRVPFGRRMLTGVVFGLADSSEVADAKLQDVSALLDEQPLLTDELMQTLAWAAGYYQHALGEVFEAALPTGLRSGRELPESGVPGFELTAGGHEALQLPGRRRGTRTHRLMDLLSDKAHSTSSLDHELPGWRSAARSLRARGWVTERRLPKQESGQTPVAAPVLNAEQQSAVDGILGSAGQYSPFLLDGVTGSGKTEVYLAAISEAVRRGRQA
ncbi:MAG: primosomal protein N', partial [Dokdonella sp.]